MGTETEGAVAVRAIPGSPALRHVIRESNFHGNAADVGGGVSLSAAGDAGYLIEACTFVNNSGTSGGGALSAKGKNAGVAATEVTQCTFQSNRAKIGGAVMVSDARRLLLNASGFENNSADLISGKGGALYAEDQAIIEVDGSAFLVNAAFNGGAVSLSMKAQALLRESLIGRNMALSVGGGFFLEDEAQAVLVNSAVHENVAFTGGGMLVHAEASLQLLGSLLEENVATTVIGMAECNPLGLVRCGHGGAVATAVRGTLHTVNVTARGNRAKAYGGFLFSATLGDVVISGSTVVHNSAELAGGGSVMWIAQKARGADGPAPMIVNGSVLAGNTAKYGTDGGESLATNWQTFGVVLNETQWGAVVSGGTMPDVHCEYYDLYQNQVHFAQVCQPNHVIAQCSNVIALDLGRLPSQA
ncbi:hypothetical protein CYMTET_51434 [Cymbomonas tetramitiformis]|uniref:Right handed beta helix domain-containing protein n=1 Tax=Cymbomonas tetramitiformis TaxID=36881 RepID=A0AAE0BMT0_9CHLO|nr:hypothetical protein CYMTET_51434 [Cymbomonas tetramitiformis]